MRGEAGSPWETSSADTGTVGRAASWAVAAVANESATPSASTSAAAARGLCCIARLLLAAGMARGSVAGVPGAPPLEDSRHPSRSLIGAHTDIRAGAARRCRAARARAVDQAAGRTLGCQCPGSPAESLEQLEQPRGVEA